MLILFENITQQQADICAVILSSSGVSYRLKKDKKGWGVWVDEAQYHRALDAVKQYFHENKNIFPIYEQKSEFNTATIISGIMAAFFLLVCYMAVHMSGNADDFVNRYGASAFMILNGEFYRTVTALMLHADEVHLAGNMISIAVFGTAVCAVCGRGLGWLMILMCGVFGNLINAFMYETGHVSIGASTAVFGAIGILAGYQGLKYQRPIKRKTAAWIPVVCGLALLGLLGSGGLRVDIMAHLFGLICGMIMGFLYALIVKQCPGKFAQLASATSVFIIIALAWGAGYY
ncbi:MAG: rhomboid family intramembrane serine protease [Dissulfuribacterales bacterium]